MAFIGIRSRSGSLLSYRHDPGGKGAPFAPLVPKGRLCHSGAAGEAQVGQHRKGVFYQECSGSIVEIHALGWHVLYLRPVIFSNFYRIASQMSWLWIEPLLICLF